MYKGFSMDKIIIEKNRGKYMCPGGAVYTKRALNAVFISSTNTVRHELAKSLGAYMLRKWGEVKFTPEIVVLLKDLERVTKDVMADFVVEPKAFITEAVPKWDKDRRVDLVCLDTLQHFEFETSKKICKEGAFTFYI